MGPSPGGLQDRFQGFLPLKFMPWFILDPRDMGFGVEGLVQ
jgi:hypothetical protein